MGGLGNQMFQTAYGMSLESRGYKVAYDQTSLGGRRPYALGIFGPRFFRHYGQEPVRYEQGMKFDASNLSPEDPGVQVGYWQSEKYFEGIEDVIREKLTIPLPWARCVGTIAMHVRRGDYVDLQHYHGLLGVDYYREAVAYIRRKVRMQAPVVVVSDDREWCKWNFPDFSVFEGQNEYEDMKMISSCDYQIISNSTFSWWGAWLGSQRLVVAPKKWFAQDVPNDVVPERWIRI